MVVASEARATSWTNDPVHKLRSPDRSTCGQSDLQSWQLCPFGPQRVKNTAWRLGFQVDPMVPYGPLSFNPYTPMIIPVLTTFKTGANRSEPFTEAKGPLGHIGKSWIGGEGLLKSA